MKRNSTILSVTIIIIILVAAWYFFMRGKGYCEVVYKQNPNTQKLEVSCDATHCTKTCYLKFRKKNSEDDWKEPNDSHAYDTAVYEYKCVCK